MRSIGGVAFFRCCCAKGTFRLPLQALRRVMSGQVLYGPFARRWVRWARLLDHRTQLRPGPGHKPLVHHLAGRDRFVAPSSFRTELSKASRDAGTRSKQTVPPAKPSDARMYRAAWPACGLGCGLTQQPSLWPPPASMQQRRVAPASPLGARPQAFLSQCEAKSARAQLPCFAEPGPPTAGGATRRLSPLTTLLEAQGGCARTVARSTTLAMPTDSLRARCCSSLCRVAQRSCFRGGDERYPLAAARRLVLAQTLAYGFRLWLCPF